MLKKVKYLTASPRHKGEVVYTVLDDRRIIFSGVTKPGSTINFAEDIISNIASQERIEPMAYRWFDLQTHRGYMGRVPGSFKFDELVLAVQEEIEAPPGVILLGHQPGAITVEGWHPLSIPEEVAELFREHIGELDAALKVWTPEEAQRAGYVPTDKHSANPGTCFDLMHIQRNRRELAAQLPLHLRAAAAKFSSSSVTEDWIVVDHEGYPEYLATSQGERYCIWQRDTSQDS